MCLFLSLVVVQLLVPSDTGNYTGTREGYRMGEIPNTMPLCALSDRIELRTTRLEMPYRSRGQQHD